jgi:hypothetical protein
MTTPAFTQAAQGDNLDAAQLAATPQVVQPIVGIGQRFFDNAETAQKHIGAKDAIRLLQEGGKHKDAIKLQNLITKAVGVGDISAVRLVSLSTETTKLFNTDTVFYNLIESRRLNTVSDFTHGWREDDFGAGALDDMVFDPNSAPPEDNNTSARRTNTLTAIGTKVDVGIVSNEMVKKRGFMDELDRQVSDSLVKVKRSTNRQMLIATENSNGPVFKMGGLITRTTANVVTVGTPADVTKANIDTVIEGIINAIGVHELAITAKAPAAQVINSWLVNQFPGSRIADFGLSTKPNARVATVYYSPLVGPVPVYLETQIPDGTLEIFAPEYVRPNGFTIGDIAGPWVLALAQTGLSQPKVIFDLITLEDRNLKSRGKVTGIN